MALSREHRLRKNRDFGLVWRRSQKAEGAFLAVRAHWKNSAPGRGAVIIPNKVSKKSAVRNRMRRRLIEWLRIKARIGEKPVDCVVYLKSGAGKASRKQLTGELQRLASALRVL